MFKKTLGGTCLKVNFALESIKTRNGLPTYLFKARNYQISVAKGVAINRLGHETVSPNPHRLPSPLDEATGVTHIMRIPSTCTFPSNPDEVVDALSQCLSKLMGMGQKKKKVNTLRFNPSKTEVQKISK